MVPLRRYPNGCVPRVRRVRCDRLDPNDGRSRCSSSESPRRGVYDDNQCVLRAPPLRGANSSVAVTAHDELGRDSLAYAKSRVGGLDRVREAQRTAIATADERQRCGSQRQAAHRLARPAENCKKSVQSSFRLARVLMRCCKHKRSASTRSLPGRPRVPQGGGAALCDIAHALGPRICIVTRAGSSRRPTNGSRPMNVAVEFDVKG